MNEALIIIDLLKDFMPGGSLAIEGGDEIVRPIVSLMPKYQTIVLVQDWHPKGHKSFASSHPGKKPFDIIEMYSKPQVLWPDHCIINTPGAEFHDSIPTSMASIILRKGTNPNIDSYSAFNENYGPGGVRTSTGLTGMLLERAVRKVTVVGLARDYCVLWSAQDIGMVIPTEVIWDLTRSVDSSKDEETKQLYLKASVVIV